MLPPVDLAVFTNNPGFSKLYKTVTGALLNSDGSTKVDEAAKKRDAVRDELKAHRLKATRIHLLRQAISTAVPDTTPSQPSKQQQQQQHRRTKSKPQPQTQQSPPLPPEIMDILLLIPPFLSHASTMTPAALTLLLSRPPFSDLATHFPQLIEVISGRLTRQANSLARALRPTTNASYIHRSIPLLPSTTITLLDTLATSKQTLTAARLAATTSLTSYLRQHTQALTLLLRALEVKHGAAARSSELRAENACLEAQTCALAVEALLWDARSTVYPPEARVALANYRRHLRVARMRLADGSRVREAELADYGVPVRSDEKDARPGRGRGGKGDEGKERTMREMARVWREMETRLGEVRGDLNRLG
ncbi:Uu.00g062590.m01.CDS01 [Anthostomella pinea]|uniref:Uu.00g062590.m01.CDS01 n=1 Tax=Anthostomella pinea TaxID=933095 RepID=A0AAI8VTZ4_9PEZI|nr:Uu.00g062590.m01.CDS01 [Anthostomella pinea]